MIVALTSACPAGAAWVSVPSWPGSTGTNGQRTDISHHLESLGAHKSSRMLHPHQISKRLFAPYSSACPRILLGKLSGSDISNAAAVCFIPRNLIGAEGKDGHTVTSVQPWAVRLRVWPGHQTAVQGAQGLINVGMSALRAGDLWRGRISPRQIDIGPTCQAVWSKSRL